MALTGEAGLREFCRANKQELCKITQVPYLVTLDSAGNLGENHTHKFRTFERLVPTVHLRRQQIQRDMWVGLVAAVRTRS